MRSLFRTLLHLLIDTLVAGGLIVSMAAIYRMDQDPAAPKPTSSGQLAFEIKDFGEGLKSQPKPKRMAVTPPVYDDMGSLLRSLGEGYDYQTIAVEDLKNPDILRNYDILFLTCRDNVKPEPAMQMALREFVTRGGTLYASDHWYKIITPAFWLVSNRCGRRVL